MKQINKKAAVMAGLQQSDSTILYKVTQKLSGMTGTPEEYLFDAFRKLSLLLAGTYDQEIIILAQDIAKQFLDSPVANFEDAKRIGDILQVEGSKYGNFTGLVVSSEFQQFWKHSRENAKTHPDRTELEDNVSLALLYLVQKKEDIPGAEVETIRAVVTEIFAEADKTLLFAGSGQTAPAGNVIRNVEDEAESSVKVPPTPAVVATPAAVDEVKAETAEVVDSVNTEAPVTEVVTGEPKVEVAPTPAVGNPLAVVPPISGGGKIRELLGEVMYIVGYSLVMSGVEKEEIHLKEEAIAKKAAEAAALKEFKKQQRASSDKPSAGCCGCFGS